MTPDVKCSRRKLFSSSVRSCTVHRVWSHIWLQATCDLISAHRERPDRAVWASGWWGGVSLASDFCDLLVNNTWLVWSSGPWATNLQLFAGGLTIMLVGFVLAVATIPSNLFLLFPFLVMSTIMFILIWTYGPTLRNCGANPLLSLSSFSFFQASNSQILTVAHNLL